MKVFNCILGVFSILGAVYCICFPGMTFLDAGWVVAILLGMYGICSIFEFCSNRSNKEKKKSSALIANGVIGLIFGILAGVISILALFNTGVRVAIDLTILVMFAVWLVCSGVFAIVGAIKQKKKGGKMWILILILGISLILTGFYSVTNLLLSAFTIGFMIGIELMVYGIRLIMSVFENND